MKPSSPSVVVPDTNILVHHGRRSPLYEWIEAQYGLLVNQSKPILSIVTVGEILSLAERRGWGGERKQRTKDFIAQCQVLPLEYPGIIEAYVILDNAGRGLGRTMGDNDLWIAATARVTGATLLTTDKDFDHLAPALLKREWIDPNTR